MKYAANQAGIYATSAHLINPRKHLEGTDKLLVDVVGWCIERYHRDQDSEHMISGALPFN